MKELTSRDHSLVRGGAGDVQVVPVPVPTPLVPYVPLIEPKTALKNQAKEIRGEQLDNTINELLGDL